MVLKALVDVFVPALFKILVSVPSPLKQALKSKITDCNSAIAALTAEAL